MVSVAIAAAVVSAAISVPVTRTSAQAPTAPSAAPKTPWGEPDLQGIWTDEFDTPLQRPAKYANQEFFTEAQRAELDNVRAAVGRRPLAPGGAKTALQTSLVCSSAGDRARHARGFSSPPTRGSSPDSCG